MKISMSEGQARQLQQLAAKDPKLAGLGRQVAKGLQKREGQPQLTADELAAVVDTLQGWAARAELSHPNMTRVLEAIPKLKAMAARTQG